MRMKICWGLCALSATATAMLGGDCGIIPFIAVDSLGAVVAAVAIAALWNHSDYRGELLPRAAYSALAGGSLTTIINVSITLIWEQNAALIPMRLALGLTGLLYGAAAAGLLLVASERASKAQPVKAHS